MKITFILLILVQTKIVLSYSDELSFYGASLAASSVNSKALFAGGNNASDIVSSVDIFDTSTEADDSPITVNLSQRKVWIASTSVLDLIIFAGGCFDFYGDQASDSVDIWNVTANSWSKISFLSQPRFWLTGTTASSFAIFAGGTSRLGPTNRVDIFNADTWAWATASLSQSRFSLVSTSIGSTALFAGGMSISGPSNAVDIYEASSRTWSVAKLSLARFNLAATTVNSLAFFAGGNTGISASDVVDIFDATSNSWSTMKLDHPRYLLAATSVGPLALFAGGIDSNGSIRGAVDVFNTTSKDWLSTQRLSRGRVSISATTSKIENGWNAMFAGGSETVETNATYIFGDVDTIDIFVYCDDGTFSSTLLKCPPVSPTPKGRASIYKILVILLGVLCFVAVCVVLFLVVREKYFKKKGYKKLRNILPYRIIKNVELLEVLGSGQFGDVYRGLMDKTIQVAVKKLKKDEVYPFEQEAGVLCSLNHPSIVRLYGVFVSQYNENMMVFEYLPEGSLLSMVKQQRAQLTIFDLLKMAQHIIGGMAYLEENHIIHRDLSLRNILISKQPDGRYIAKVSDFGLSRIAEKGYYKTDDKTMPVKWSAIEAIEYGNFTMKTDVWSFGITLWELFSFGKMPYPGMSNAEVIQQVSTGYRLPPPVNCPEEIYSLMLSCWAENPEQRPSFSELASKIEELIVKYKQPNTIMSDTDFVVAFDRSEQNADDYNN